MARQTKRMHKVKKNNSKYPKKRRPQKNVRKANRSTNQKDTSKMENSPKSVVSGKESKSIVLEPKLSKSSIPSTKSSSPNRQSSNQKNEELIEKINKKRKISVEKRRKKQRKSPIPWSESCRGTCVETSDGYLYDQDDYAAQHQEEKKKGEHPKSEKQKSSLQINKQAKQRKEEENPKSEKQKSSLRISQEADLTTSLLKFLPFDLSRKKSKEKQKPEIDKKKEKKGKDSKKKGQKQKSQSKEKTSSTPSKKPSKEKEG